MMHLTTKGIREGAGSMAQPTMGGGTRRSKGLQTCVFLHGQRSKSTRDRSKRLEEEELKKKRYRKKLMDFWIRVNRDPVSFHRARTGWVIRKLSILKSFLLQLLLYGYA